RSFVDHPCAQLRPASPLGATHGRAARRARRRRGARDPSAGRARAEPRPAGRPLLAQTLLERELVRDPGDLRVLRRYERGRAEPILAMDAMVDGLFRLFGSGSSAVSRLRNAGLNLT